MKPTRARDLVGVALVVGVLVWLVVRAWYGQITRPRWYVSVPLVVLALVEAYGGYQLRARIQRRPGTRPVDGLAAARWLALAKATALVASAVFGAWCGVLAYTVPKLGFLTAAGEDTTTAAVGAGCAGLLVAAALWLESCLRVPKPPEDEDPEHRDR